MFDLEDHVRAWRQSAATTLGDNPPLLDELESHLRDELDRLRSLGKPPEEAWADAVQRLGRPQQIRDELLKTDPPSWLPAKLTAGLLAIGIFVVGWLFVVRLRAGSVQALLAAHVVAVTAGYGAVFAIGFLGACAVLCRAVGSWEGRQDVAFCAAGRWLGLVALFSTSVGVVLGAWWSREHLGRSWGWDVREIGGLCVLAWAGLLVQCFRTVKTTPQLRMGAAVTGDMLVALAWFGPVVGARSYGYGSPTSVAGMALGCFLVVQVLLISLTVAEPGFLRRRHVGTGE